MQLIHLLAALIGAFVLFLTLRGNLILRVDGSGGVFDYLPAIAGAVVLGSGLDGMLG